jgi:hypothetical protein
MGKVTGNQRKIEFSKIQNNRKKEKNEKNHYIHDLFDDTDSLHSVPGPDT